MAKKKAVKKAAQKAQPKKSTKKKTTAKKATAKKAPVKKNVAKKATPAKAAVKKSAAQKVVVKAAPKKAAAAAPAKKKKKGVRRATMTTGIRKTSGKTMGRSRIPVDAPLSVVFQNVLDAQEAFNLLGILTVRELELFDPDELVMRLTSPAKQTVGRIRKILAMNNRCLLNDEAFALEYKERLEAAQKLPPT